MESFFERKKSSKQFEKSKALNLSKNFYLNFVHSNYVAAHAFMQRIYHAF